MKLMQTFMPLALAGLVAYSGEQAHAQENTADTAPSNTITREEMLALNAEIAEAYPNARLPAIPPPECKVEPLTDTPPLSNKDMQEIGNSTYAKFREALQNEHSHSDPETLNVLANAATDIYTQLIKATHDFPQNICITYEEFNTTANNTLAPIQDGILKERLKKAKDYFLDTVITDGVFSKNEHLNYIFLRRDAMIKTDPFYSVEELADLILSKLDIERTNVNVWGMRVMITEAYIFRLDAGGYYEQDFGTDGPPPQN